jgi:hypothetical protein
VLAEVFRSVTDGVWCDLPNGAAKEEKKTTGANGTAKPEKKTGPSSIMRRNLQREHVKKLSSLVLGQRTGSSGGFAILFGSSNSSSTPPDARSLARMHLREIDKRIEGTLSDKQAALDDTARAHLEECHERIGKVLSASMQVND